MVTYEQLVLAYENLQVLSTFTAGILILIGLVLYAMPVGECASCAHCAKARTERNQPICPLHRIARNKCEDQHRD
jgi:hypothetical protein